jgi:hypothetical protein
LLLYGATYHRHSLPLSYAVIHCSILISCLLRADALAGLTRLSYDAAGDGSAVLALPTPAEGSAAAAAAADREEPQQEPPAAQMVSKLQLDALFMHVGGWLVVTCLAEGCCCCTV